MSATEANDSHAIRTDEWFPTTRPRSTSLRMLYTRFVQEAGSSQTPEPQLLRARGLRLWLWMAWIYVITTSRGYQREDQPGNTQWYSASTSLADSHGQPLAEWMVYILTEAWFRQLIYEQSRDMLGMLIFLLLDSFIPIVSDGG